MPKWCAGTLRVRGKKRDLQNFITDGLELLPTKGKDTLVLESDGCGSVYYDGTCYIKGTSRGFINNLNVYFVEDDDEDDYIQTIALDVEFAWDISSEELLKVCQKYHVDMRIYAFERGMEFNLEIEIINGKITKESYFSFQDYMWECICPNVGG